MNYKGKELKEYRSEEPIFFDPPKMMICWNRDTDIPLELRVFSYDNRGCIPVVVAETAEDEMPQTWKHCAEIPEEYYSVVAVERRAVSGVNRYALGKFPSRQDAQLAMLKMIGLLGGDPVKGSHDMYVVPFDAVRGLPNPVHDERCDSDTIPRYLVHAYDVSMKKFPGEEDTGRPRIKDLPSDSGDVYAPREETPRELSNEDKVAMVTKLRQKTERGLMPCKRALEECGWDYDKAYAFIRELPAARASKETVRHAMVIDEMVGKSNRITDLMTRTGWGPYHCKKALEAYSWNLDAAERMLKEKFKDFATKK